MTVTWLILGEPSSYLIFSSLSSFHCPFLSLCSSHWRILSKSITIIQRRKPKTMNHVQQSSTQESPSIVILGAREWKMEFLAIWQRVFYLVCALLGMGVEGAGGGDFIGERGCSGGGCGVVVTEQVSRGSRCDKGKGACCLRRWRWVRCKRGRGWR